MVGAPKSGKSLIRHYFLHILFMRLRIEGVYIWTCYLGVMLSLEVWCVRACLRAQLEVEVRWRCLSHIRLYFYWFDVCCDWKRSKGSWGCSLQKNQEKALQLKGLFTLGISVNAVILLVTELL